MTTTQESVEKDEEKEFIQHQIWKLFGKEGTEQLYLEDVKHCMGKVAAFSTKRAREKHEAQLKELVEGGWLSRDAMLVAIDVDADKLKSL